MEYRVRYKMYEKGINKVKILIIGAMNEKHLNEKLVRLGVYFYEASPL